MVRPTDQDQSQTPANRATTSKRPTAVLSEKLEKRLIGYALAAGAAGVGLMAGATPAAASIIYTPTNVQMLVNLPNTYRIGLPTGNYWSDVFSTCGSAALHVRGASVETKLPLGFTSTIR
jgi:hypothetical protein